MRLTILPDRSILEVDGKVEEFFEGPQSVQALARLKRIKTAFAGGLLEKVIDEEKTEPSQLTVDEDDLKRIETLVHSVTSEAGRALVGLTVMQASIKMIEPEQNIRLHKGGSAGGDGFAWREGVSMRTLDKAYVTPTLRKYGLLSLNADGFMMTRSLAENYPYSKLYKAALRGAKSSWLDIVDRMELGHLDPEAALRVLIGLLLNRTAEFETLADKALQLTEMLTQTKTPLQIQEFLLGYISSDDYSARLFEVAIHSLFQVLEEDGAIDGYLKPLSQMRSANKKHKNVGDVEIEIVPDTRMIVEAWDAKFGKIDLRDEIEELFEKLKPQPECRLAGFVTDQDPLITASLVKRIQDIEESLGNTVRIEILSLRRFIEQYVSSRVDIGEISARWLRVFIECLAQKRRGMAPIDEPCHDWLRRYIQAID